MARKMKPGPLTEAAPAAEGEQSTQPAAKCKPFVTTAQTTFLIMIVAFASLGVVFGAAAYTGLDACVRVLPVADREIALNQTLEVRPGLFVNETNASLSISATEVWVFEDTFTVLEDLMLVVLGVTWLDNQRPITYDTLVAVANQGFWTTRVDADSELFMKASANYQMLLQLKVKVAWNRSLVSYSEQNFELSAFFFPNRPALAGNLISEDSGRLLGQADLGISLEKGTTTIEITGLCIGLEELATLVAHQTYPAFDFPAAQRKVPLEAFGVMTTAFDWDDAFGGGLVGA